MRRRSKSKYKNVSVEYNGIVFASELEGNQYLYLKSLQDKGEIGSLEVQPKFLLQKGFKDRNGKRHRKIEYIADFIYVQDRCVVVEDVKGFKTPVFRIKEKLFRYRYPEIDLRLVS